MGELRLRLMEEYSVCREYRPSTLIEVLSICPATSVIEQLMPAGYAFPRKLTGINVAVQFTSYFFF
jgi:hypothetical protein